MKELITLGQKAKAYDEALERVKKLLSRCRNNRDRITMVYRVNDIESIFPELKKSEDEKIRKAILAFIRQSSEVLNKQNQNNMIAWLEKQSEQEKPQVYKTKDGETITYSETEGYNIVEPKFHEGDWITNGDYTWKIIEVKPLDYILQSQDGNIVDDTTSHVDEQFHSFTIEDAKEGDVLAFYCEYKGNKMVQVGIIEKYVGKHGGCSNTFKIYVGVDWENNLKIGEYMGCPDIRPATKEQRDTLFAKMHEAEYDWDTEKKELKKIEESENIKNQIMSEITDLVKDYITQKSAKCSEEDELSCFENALFTAFSDAWQQYLRGKEVDIAQWAKEHSKELLEAAKEELKGHNSAWSEEDTEISSMLIELIESKEKSIEAKVEFVAWLKSLKKRMNNV